MRLSVVIPLRNKAPWIRSTLESVLAQARPAHEIIVVDDGSTDGSAAVAEDMARTAPALRVIRTPNRGPAAARNTRFAAATGTHVCLLDADDLWAREHLQALAAALARWPDTAVMATGLEDHGRHWQPDARFTALAGTVEGMAVHDLPDSLRAIAAGRYYLTCSATAIARTVLDSCHRFRTEAEPNEDVNFWIAVRSAGPIRVVDRPTATWRRVDANSMTLRRPARAMTIPHVMAGLAADTLTAGDRAHLRRYIVRRYLGLALRNAGCPFTWAEVTANPNPVPVPLWARTVYLALRFLPATPFRLVRRGWRALRQAGR